MFGLQSNLWAESSPPTHILGCKKTPGCQLVFALKEKSHQVERKKRFGKIIVQNQTLKKICCFLREKTDKIAGDENRWDEMEFWCGRVFRSSFPQTKTLALSGGGSELRMVVQKIRTILKELLKETMLLAHSFFLQSRAWSFSLKEWNMKPLILNMRFLSKKHILPKNLIQVLLYRLAQQYRIFLATRFEDITGKRILNLEFSAKMVKESLMISVLCHYVTKFPLKRNLPRNVSFFVKIRRILNWKNKIWSYPYIFLTFWEFPHLPWLFYPETGVSPNLIFFSTFEGQKLDVEFSSGSFRMRRNLWHAKRRSPWNFICFFSGVYKIVYSNWQDSRSAFATSKFWRLFVGNLSACVVEKTDSDRFLQPKNPPNIARHHHLQSTAVAIGRKSTSSWSAGHLSIFCGQWCDKNLAGPLRFTQIQDQYHDMHNT